MTLRTRQAHAAGIINPQKQTAPLASKILITQLSNLTEMKEFSQVLEVTSGDNT